MKKVYAVRGIRSASFGVVEVTVPQSVIDLRGEVAAVKQAAWYKLLGKNDLGEDIDKKLPTRHFIMTEMLSRVASQRNDVFTHFCENTTIHLMRIEHG